AGDGFLQRLSEDENSNEYSDWPKERRYPLQYLREGCHLYSTAKFAVGLSKSGPGSLLRSKSRVTGNVSSKSSSAGVSIFCSSLGTAPGLSHASHSASRVNST